jgi:hypothetical protein
MVTIPVIKMVRFVTMARLVIKNRYKLNDVHMFTFVTNLTSVPIIAYYQGHQCAYICLLPRSPVCLCLFVTKVTSEHIFAILPSLPVCLSLREYAASVSLSGYFKFVYCVYGLFNDAVSNSGCFVSNGSVIREQM